MAAAEHYWIDTDLLAAVMLVESNGRERALSNKGAIGLMQIMPNYHSCASYEPAANVDCGASILAHHIQANNGAWRPALAQYYAGVAGAARGLGREYAELVLATYQRATSSTRIGLD